METAYVDRYREELSDIFSRIVKIEIYFGNMKKKAKSDFEQGLISEKVYKEVISATYRTILSEEAKEYALDEDDRLLVLKYASNPDVEALYLDDLNTSFTKLIERMDDVAYSVKTYHKYYSMDVETLRSNVLELVTAHYEEKKLRIESEMRELTKSGDSSTYDSEAYKALQASLDGINDAQDMMVSNVMVASYEVLINYIVKKFNINENYWNWYRVRNNQEEYAQRADTSVPFESVLKVDGVISDLNEELLSYDQVVNKLTESYQLFNQFAQDVALINNVRKVIVNRKCNKKECLSIFAKFYQLPVFCDYIASYAVGDVTEINSNEVFELFYAKHFGDAKAVDYEEFRLTVIKEVFEHYKARIAKYTEMLQSSRLGLEQGVSAIRSANNASVDSVRLLNDLTIDSIDETDYLGDTIPREERDRLYFSLKEYFKVISTGNDAFKKTFK